MKRSTINCCIFALLLLFPALAVTATDALDTAKSPLVITLSYFSVDNNVQYLTVTARSKVSGKFQPVKSAEIKLYLGKDSAGKGIGFIGKVVTDEKGKAVANIPPSLSQIWKSSVSHTFIAVTHKTKLFDGTSTEIIIARSRISLDTASDKNVTAVFTEFKDSAWVPVKGVEIKLGIERLGGDLPIGDDQSYTTDSLGRVKGEFKRPGLPGDETGNIVLAAKVEDNDQYGNLRVEKTEPWGIKFIANKDFFHRALWASRFHSPVWLVVMAYSILIAVWGTLIYLFILLIKIRKLGRRKKPQD